MIHQNQPPKQTESNDLSQTKRFLTEIIEIIFKNLKYVLLHWIYFCFNLAAKFLTVNNYFLFIIVLYERNSLGPKDSTLN